jgi:hypothetical protein
MRRWKRKGENCKKKAKGDSENKHEEEEEEEVSETQGREEGNENNSLACFNADHAHPP